jgi:hypothetical protein
MLPPTPRETLLKMLVRISRDLGVQMAMVDLLEAIQLRMEGVEGVDFPRMVGRIS